MSDLELAVEGDHNLVIIGIAVRQLARLQNRRDELIAEQVRREARKAAAREPA